MNLSAEQVEKIREKGEIIATALRRASEYYRELDPAADGLEALGCILALISSEPPQADARAEELVDQIKEIGQVVSVAAWEYHKPKIGALLADYRREVLEQAAERLNKAAEEHIEQNGKYFASTDYARGLKNGAKIVLGDK